MSSMTSISAAEPKALFSILATMMSVPMLTVPNASGIRPKTSHSIFFRLSNDSRHLRTAVHENDFCFSGIPFELPRAGLSKHLAIQKLRITHNKPGQVWQAFNGRSTIAAKCSTHFTPGSNETTTVGAPRRMAAKTASELEHSLPKKDGRNSFMCCHACGRAGWGCVDPRCMRICTNKLNSEHAVCRQKALRDFTLGRVKPFCEVPGHMPCDLRSHIEQELAPNSMLIKEHACLKGKDPQDLTDADKGPWFEIVSDGDVVVSLTSRDFRNVV